RTLHAHEAGEGRTVRQRRNRIDADVEAGFAVLADRPGAGVDHRECTVDEEAVGYVEAGPRGDEAEVEAQVLERFGSLDRAFVVEPYVTGDERATGVTPEDVAAVAVQPGVGEVEVVDVVHEAEGI